MTTAADPYEGKAQIGDEHYRYWTARFDLLWSSPVAHSHRTEMALLIALINWYEGVGNLPLANDC